ncbi:MAG: ACP S-malonyltransferase [Kiritimatiellae bacterium]|nr:ACP S-malonyltransferase [Kiritimatiellia bacterium]
MTKSAMLFSGQGAQAVGMGRDLVETFPACRALAERADEVLGFRLTEVAFNGPEEQLTRSDVAQPAIFLVSAMCFEALKQQGEPKVYGLAGLSLGEWTALYAAGVLSFDDTLRILRARGQFMQTACEKTRGGMLSLLGLTLEQAQAVAEESGLEVANINSPGQIVLSGPVDRIADAEAVAKERGAKRAIPLNVAGAFHSSLMAPAAEQLGPFLAEISFAAPRVPVVSNVTARPHANNPDEIRRTMVRQVTGSVRWVETIDYFKAQGVVSYTECGPGKVLTGLVKRIDNTAALHNIQNALDIQNGSKK